MPETKEGVEGRGKKGVDVAGKNAQLPCWGYACSLYDQLFRWSTTTTAAFAHLGGTALCVILRSASHENRIFLSCLLWSGVLFFYFVMLLLFLRCLPGSRHKYDFYRARVCVMMKRNGAVVFLSFLCAVPAKLHDELILHFCIHLL